MAGVIKEALNLPKFGATVVSQRYDKSDAYIFSVGELINLEGS
jgi:hypothetical protein